MMNDRTGTHTASPEAARHLFERTFGAAPEVVASAPGRVNLIGEHTDYNGGEVLPIAIDRRTYVAVRRASGLVSRAASSHAEQLGEIDLRTAHPAGAWWDYVHGAARELLAQGVDAPAFDLAVVSDVPTRAGLSSSAALEVASAAALLALAGAQWKPVDLANAAHRAETGFVGVACGIMDQFAVTLARRAHALHLWCDSGRTEHVPMRDAVLVFDTVIPRQLLRSDFNTRRKECERALALMRRRYPALPHLAAADPAQIAAAELPEALRRRALHVATESRRVGVAVRALRTTAQLPGELLFDSHESLRALYECSRPELDWFVDRAMRMDGVRGARLTGAGWGGCAIAIGTRDGLIAAAPVLVHDYAAAFGRTPAAWITHPGEGVRLESV